VKAQVTLVIGVGQKKGATILTTGIVCSRTIPASAVRGLWLDREFQRPASFQPYIGSVAGELPRTLQCLQNVNLQYSGKYQIARCFREMLQLGFN